MRKLPGFHPAPAGYERSILRKLPTALLAGTLLPALFAAAAPIADPEQLQAFRYLLAGLVLTHWILLFGLALGCVIVVVMKGHAWVADGYVLPDRDQPRSKYDEPV